MSLAFRDAVDAIALESRRLADAVGTTDLEVQVPSCPEWTVRDLAHHIGVVQWYWAQNVAAADAEKRSGGELTPVPADADLVAWLGWCTYSLTSALRAAGPEAPCWTWWGEPRSSGAVGHHQAQEAAVHRWDAELAAGTVEALPVELANDGVPDFVSIMVGNAANALSGTVTLTAVDTGASWQVGPDASAGSRQAELRATASDLVLMMYRRLPVPDDTVVGDPMLVAAFLSLANTR